MPDDAEPVARTTPPEAWLLTLALDRALELATAEDFRDARRLELIRDEHTHAEWSCALPPAHAGRVWLRLAPGGRHPWRETWIAALELEGAPERREAALTAVEPVACLPAVEGARLRVRALVAYRYARAEPPPLCEPVAVRDVAYACHTRQSSVDDDGPLTALFRWMAPTRAEPRPWWELNLGASHYVDTIRVHAPVRPGAASVQVYSHQDPSGAPVISWMTALALDGDVQTIEVGEVGRYVRIELRAPEREEVSLALAAVEVFAVELTAPSLLESALRSVTLFADRPLLAHRSVTQEGYGGYDEWMRYREVWARATALASGLARRLERDAALKKQPPVFVGVCARGRAEWPIVDLACLQRGYVVVPLAHTAGPETLRHIVDECGIQAIACEPGRVEALRELAEECASLRLIVELTPLPDERATTRTEGVSSDRLRHETIAALERLGAELGPRPLTRRRRDALFSVLYTSGSTGRPKGTMRSHGAFNEMLNGYGVVQPAVHCSYQPFSHLSERMMTPVVLRHGGQIGFASGDPARLFDDIAALRPTFVGGVPRVFDVLRARYHEALVQRLRARPEAARAELEDELLAELRALFGPRLQAVSVGSAKSSPALLEFMRRLFQGCWVLDGYGITEVGTIAVDGVIQRDVDVRLIDAPELGYRVDDTPSRGEICVRTPHMFGGYLGDPDDRGPLDADGYFHTGDIGERREDGSIQIIGRRKHVVKLAQGEFVAPEQIEAALLRCALVEQLYVHADPLEACVVAIVIPNQLALRDQLERAGPSTTAPALVLRALREEARRQGLPTHEAPAAVHLDARPMTVESGLLTASLKPDRAAIARHYQAALTDLYGSANGSA
ncbi:MAG: AMP-binding protein, partial [Myxococcales bacterium]|nr:AMP-binding protein [Myxococcales bacterium]